MHLCDENGANKSFGFVDYVAKESAERACAEKTQLMFPGQYVRVSKVRFVICRGVGSTRLRFFGPGPFDADTFRPPNTD